GQQLPAGRELLTQVDAPVRIRPNDRDAALTQRPQVFQTLHPVMLRAAHNRLRFHTWSDEECCLPRGATRATLVNDGGVQLSAGALLVLEEALGPSSGLPEDADPLHRHAVRLTAVEPSTDDVENADVVRVEWANEDALPFQLCLSVLLAAQSGDELLRDVSVALGNVVLADHGEAVSGETLDPEAVTSRYRPALRQTGLTF